MIFNKTRKRVISKRFSTKKGLGKVIGLMGSKAPETIVFKTRFGIHTFFLKFPIDLLVLDKNGKAVLAKRNVKPNRIVFWNLLYSTVIELPTGSLYKSKTQKGDIIKL